MLSRGSTAFGTLLIGLPLLAGAVPGRSDGSQSVIAVYGKALPDVVLRNPATGAKFRLADLATGRPAVILVTDGATGASCPLARAMAAHQPEYAPWFTWTGIISGPCSPERMANLRDSSPVRFQTCLHDPDESVRRALGLERLPALVLVNESGYVHTVCAAGDAAARPDELARTMYALAAGSRWAGGTLADFRLPRVGAEGLASFLDVAGRNFTLISFLHSGCLPCARELGVLEYLRDRHADGVKLVTVFLDAARDERIIGYLEAARVRPDTILRDPDLRLAMRYQVSAVPALLVVDGGGRIVHARRGFREEERLTLYREIDAVLRDPAEALAACPVVRDPRRIHADACAYLREGRPEYALLYLERLREIAPGRHTVHLLIAEAALAAGRRELALESYARYLAADPMAYDRGDVRARLATLLDGRR